jgi:tRNA A-37 threonylcarbamoyl transferase component Bud32
VIEIVKHRAALETLGLATLEGVRAYTGLPLKTHGGKRDVFRIETPAATLFLKRNWRPHKKDGLASLLRHGEVRSVARREWDNCLRLQRAGIRTAELVAYGEECGPLWETFSFIITEAAPGRPLSALLEPGNTGGATVPLLQALAREIRKMHDAGLFSPDLFARHIFVDGDRFTLIDMARVDDGPAERDLAALNVTVPLRQLSARQRLRFLQAYGRPELFRRIERRVRYLLKRRRKFADFA